MTSLNVFILFANKLCSNGCEHARRLFGSDEYLRALRLFDSSAKSSTSINVSRGGTSVLRLSRSQTQDGRWRDARWTPILLRRDARRTQDGLYRRDARRTQMKRGRSDRLFLSSTVCATKYRVKCKCYIWASLCSASGAWCRTVGDIHLLLL